MRTTTQPPPPPFLTPIPCHIPDRVLRAVYASDQAMYPAPLSYDRLRAWVAASAELSVSFRVRDDSRQPEDDGGDDGAAGVVVALPLRRAHWEAVLDGRLREPDIDPEAGMFPGPGEEEVGLHVYHIERFNVWSVESSAGNSRGGTGTGTTRGWGREGKPFSEYALDEVTRRARERKEWRVVGLSGMCPRIHQSTPLKRLDALDRQE